jgi:hypothetical protein
MITQLAAKYPNAEIGITGEDAVAMNAIEVVKEVVSMAPAARLYA